MRRPTATRFSASLHHRAKEEEYQWLLRTAWKLAPGDSLAHLGSGLNAPPGGDGDLLLLRAPESYATGVARALRQGNDTDTVMGMAGAWRVHTSLWGAVVDHRDEQYELNQ